MNMSVEREHMSVVSLQNSYRMERKYIFHLSTLRQRGEAWVIFEIVHTVKSLLKLMYIALDEKLLTATSCQALFLLLGPRLRESSPLWHHTNLQPFLQKYCSLPVSVSFCFKMISGAKYSKEPSGVFLSTNKSYVCIHHTPLCVYLWSEKHLANPTL